MFFPSQVPESTTSQASLGRPSCKSYINRAFKSVSKFLEKDSRTTLMATVMGAEFFMPSFLEGFLAYSTAIAFIEATIVIGNYTEDTTENIFLRAVKSENESKIKQLLSLNINVNTTDELGKTALMLASEKRYNDGIVKLLVNHQEIDANIQDNEGKTALMHGVSSGYYKNVELLLQHPRIDVNKRDNEGKTALMQAVAKRNYGIIIRLLAHKEIDVNIKDEDGGSLFNIAISRYTGEYNAYIIQELLKHPNIHIDCESLGSLSNILLTNAVEIGQEDVVTKLLEYPKIDVNVKDGGNTALTLAIQYRHNGIVKILLKHPDIDINCQYYGPQCISLLRNAVEIGQEDVVTKLLEYPKIQLNGLGKNRNEILSLALTNGHDGIIKKILKHPYLKVYYEFKEYRLSDILLPKALTNAVEIGQEAIVTELLKYPNIDVNEKDSADNTALKLALEQGHDGIVKILLEHPNIEVDGEYLGSLSNKLLTKVVALCNRFAKVGTKVVEIKRKVFLDKLFEFRGIDVNTQGTDGKTALILAAEKGELEIVAHLLRHPEINVNIKDIEGITALGYALEHKNKKMAMLLMENTQFDWHQISDYSIFHFIFALESFENQLFTCFNVDYNTRLGIAVKAGCKDIVTGLLKCSEVDVNYQKTRWDKTVLMEAVESENYEIIELLLQHPGIDLNKRAHFGKTVLMEAVERRAYYIVELLLQHPGIDLNKQYNDRSTALMLAVRTGLVGIVGLLLRQPGIDVNIQNNDRSTALMLAVGLGRREIVELLLQQPGIDVNIQNNDRSTALMLAVESGNYEIVELLLQQPGIDVNIRDKDGSTALMLAVESGNYEIVELLLQQPGIGVNLTDKDARSVLMSALKNGQVEIAENLLNHREISVCLTDIDVNLAFISALKNGYDGVVDLFIQHPRIREEDILREKMIGNGKSPKINFLK